MKILLAGASGMVGKNIVDLKPNNVSLFTPDLDELNLLSYSDTLDYIKKNKPDLIIHAAGIVGGIQANINYPVKFLRENVLLGHNLIWAAFESGVNCFLNLGSSCMYPKNAENPLQEDLILKGELEPTNEGYAIAKVFAQRFCEYINRENNAFLYKTIIPCNLYGKYDKFGSEWGHLIPAVISKIHNAKIQNQNIVEIWGDGEARREFMYTEDLADLIWTTIKQFEKLPDLLNVGLGYDFTINEYYQTISKVIGYTGSFKHDLSKPVGMKQKLVDTTKLKNFGWSPKYGLEEGIQKTYNYFLSNN